jgi:hypothetical protein
MALMRCRLHAPAGRTRSYAYAVEPMGFPSTALVCGTPKCNASAYIWLEKAEKKIYDQGQRVFAAPTKAMKVRAR